MIKLIELIKKAIKGDKESFDTLIRSRSENIYRLAFSYTKNREDALDVVQDVIYKALVSINDLKQPEYFNTWLTRITINCSINHLKKIKKVVHIEEKSLKEVSSYSNNSEEVMDLHQALKDLEEKYRTIIILKYFQDLTLQDISEVLNMPLNTVKTQLYRGLKKLKIYIEEEIEVE